MVTSKKKVTESIVKARADLEQALSDLEHLPVFESGEIAFAAHALANFLTVIRGTVELLLISLKDYRGTQVWTKLEGLLHATTLMMHTVNQLMNTSATAEIKLVYEPVDLVHLARRLCDYYRRLAKEKQIRIVFNSREVPAAWTDRVAVAAVLDNFMSNAVKYSPPNKKILVRVTVESQHVVCGVQDEGPGLSREDQARLFQKGARLGAVPTGGEPSTGYGLAVAKELVDKLGGEIWCESELGQGARFCFRLPMAPGHSPVSPPSGEKLRD
ncbi:MAG TPA: HAMP domain-containing sensor histidine kinase [Terriglobia bacterium]|nr:HAMP domain-containing sensor histidine kinase [Terriglobia bacterium]